MSVEVRPSGQATAAPGNGAAPPSHTTPEVPAATSDEVPAAAPGASRPPIPHWVFVVVAAAAAVFVLSMAVSARFLTGSTGAAPPTVLLPAAHPVHRGNAPPAGSRQIHGALASFLGLQALHDEQAPPFTLSDAATGKSVSLAGLHGHEVVLTFANGSCDDICPVLLSELGQARALLRGTPVPVTFLTVNTDPLDALKSPALDQPAFPAEKSAAGLAGWRFLNGSVPQLNSVWTAYGISITVDKADGDVAHNNRLYFIGPDGRIAWIAVPFADQSGLRSFSLPPAQVARFAQGIAHYARRLAGKPS